MFKKMFQYMGKYKKYVFLCFFLVTGTVVSDLMMPMLMAKIVDVGIASKDMGYIARMGILMVVLACSGIAFGMGNMRLSADASQGFAANLRKAVFDRVQSFSFSNIDKFSTASLVTRLTNDISQLQVTVMMMLRILMRAPLMLICAMGFAMYINMRLSVIIFISVPLLITAAFFITRAAKRLFTLVQKRIDGVNGAVRENLTAIRVVKAFVRESYEKSKFKKVNDALTHDSIKAGDMISLIMPCMLLILNVATVAVIWFGGGLVGTGSMGSGELLSFLSYLMQIMMSTMMFTMVFILFARAQACASRVLEVIETAPDIKDNAGPGCEREVKNGKIEFRHVSFRYYSQKGSKGENVLSDINFTANPGEVVAVIGGAGSGKTTLVSLIPRLYDAAEGSVLVDGADVRSYSLKKLRDGIGIVLQKNVLFSGTIRENLMWGDAGATDGDIRAAAADAQADGFVSGFPHGYETELGQGGVNVSGGQKQRLCIARAMLKHPKILILDDSTSAVDTATEAKIRRSFRENLKDTTVIIIAQRISSVKDADKIIVLDDGKINGIGTHEELLRGNPIYREICNSQSEGMVS